MTKMRFAGLPKKGWLSKLTVNLALPSPLRAASPTAVLALPFLKPKVENHVKCQYFSIHQSFEIPLFDMME